MNKIITISREYGAGGHSIGKQVAQQLGIPFYDKDILRESVKASGFDTELVRRKRRTAPGRIRSSGAFAPFPAPITATPRRPSMTCRRR